MHHEILRCAATFVFKNAKSVCGIQQFCRGPIWMDMFGFLEGGGENKLLNTIRSFFWLLFAKWECDFFFLTAKYLSAELAKATVLVRLELQIQTSVSVRVDRQRWKVWSQFTPRMPSYMTVITSVTWQVTVRQPQQQVEMHLWQTLAVLSEVDYALPWFNQRAWGTQWGCSSVVYMGSPLELTALLSLLSSSVQSLLGNTVGWPNTKNLKAATSNGQHVPSLYLKLIDLAATVLEKRFRKSVL